MMCMPTLKGIEKAKQDFPTASDEIGQFLSITITMKYSPRYTVQLI